MKKRHKDIAHRIVELEKLAQEKPNFNYSSEMMKLIGGLGVKELVEIDDYIQNNNLLTK